MAISVGSMSSASGFVKRDLHLADIIAALSHAAQQHTTAWFPTRRWRRWARSVAYWWSAPARRQSRHHWQSIASGRLMVQATPGRGVDAWAGLRGAQVFDFVNFRRRPGARRLHPARSDVRDVVPRSSDATDVR